MIVKKSLSIGLLTLCMFVVAIFSIIIRYTVYPPKFFYDSNHILNLMNDNLTFEPQHSFALTALFSRTINVFNFTQLYQWSIFYAFFFNVFIILFLRKFSFKTYYDYFFFFASVGLLNIYVCNLSKESFQFMIFLFVGLIILSRSSLTSRAIKIFILLFAWGLLYRIYYILIACYYLSCYLFLTKIKTKSKLKLTTYIILHVCVILIIVFFSLFSASLLMPDEYNTIINIHSRLNQSREGSPDALTMINDLVDTNGNLFIYMFNYLANMIRMMLPFELLLNFKFNYILFWGYQILLSSLFIKKSLYVYAKKATKESILAFCVYSGFLMGSALFEPDFGTWVRHQTAALPILIPLVFERRAMSSERVFLRIIT